MKRGICYIVGAGEWNPVPLAAGDDDMVIAVDGGYEYLKGQRIDMAVGDFDSLSYVPEHPHLLRLPAEKDDTDMLAAIREGRKAGYQTFYIYGGRGGRLDHTLANIQCLAYLAKQGARGHLIGQREAVTVIREGSISFAADFPAGENRYISVFCYGERAEGVTLRGLKYPLRDAVLENTFPIGVSNEFVGKAASISVKKGMLLVVYPFPGAAQ